MPKPTPEPEYIANCEDACTDAAHRIIVAIRLIGIEEARREDDLDDGGYGLTEAIRILHDIREDLQKSVAKAEAERKQDKGE